MSIADKLTQIAENEQRVYNAGYEAGKGAGGSSEVIDRSEAWFAENFPSDVWRDGEYIDGLITVRYKYRADRTDPKDIDICDENGIERAIHDVDGEDRLAVNLIEYYLEGVLCKCGRMWVEYGSDLAQKLYENPVVITYVDLSEAFSDAYCMQMVCKLHAMQASLKNYDGKAHGEAVNNDTFVSYFIESNAEDIVGEIEAEAEARHLYALCNGASIGWYYEEHTSDSLGDSNGSYAYSGACASASGYLTWKDDEQEQGDSPLPIEVATEAEMTALLTSGEIGGVYKYTGETTDTYENGALYVLEEE